MHRLLAALFVIVLTLAGGTSMAAAGANQPGEGERSTGRNDAGFGEGPHCHVVVANEGVGPFDIRVFPSHTGHDHAGNDVFAADGDCDGAPGGTAT
jgi:hypothetical protein